MTKKINPTPVSPENYQIRKGNTKIFWQKPAISFVGKLRDIVRAPKPSYANDGAAGKGQLGG